MMHPDLRLRVYEIIAASAAPLDASAIRRQLRGEFALKPKQLPELAALLPDVPGLVAWPAAKASGGPRYWTQTPEAVAEAAAVAAASNEPVTPKKLISVLAKGRTGLPRARAESLLLELEERGKLHRKPLLAEVRYKLVSRLTEVDRLELQHALRVIERSLAAANGAEVVCAPAAFEPVILRKVTDQAVLEMLEQVEPRKGLVVTAHRLRAALPDAAKHELDEAVMRLYRSGKVLLHKHSGPFLLPEEERRELIQSGADYYVGICWNTGGL